MFATLIAHVDCHKIDRNRLHQYPTPPSTRSYVPVPHGVLADTLVDSLAARGIDVLSESWAVGGAEDARLFGALDLRIPGYDAPDFGFGLGIRHSNDKKFALRLVQSARVFVCDNLAFAGGDDAFQSKRRHTARLNVRDWIFEATDRYLDGVGHWQQTIDDLKSERIGDDDARRLLCRTFGEGVDSPLPLRFLPRVCSLYFDDPEQDAKHGEWRGTLWGLNQAFTEAVKAYGTETELYHEATAAIGGYFDRLLRGSRTVVHVDGLALPN